MASDLGARKIELVHSVLYDAVLRDQDRAEDREDSRAREADPAPYANHEEALTLIASLARSEQDPKALRTLREQVLPSTDKRTPGVSRRTAEQAMEILKTIDTKIAYLELADADEETEEAVTPAAARPEVAPRTHEQLIEELGLKLDALKDDDSVWARTGGQLPDSNTRRDLIHGCVVGEEGYSPSQILPRIRSKERERFREEIRAMQALFAQVSKAETPVVEAPPVRPPKSERTRRERPQPKAVVPVVETRPVMAETTALAQLKDSQEQAQERDRARRERLYAEADAIAAEALKVPEDKAGDARRALRRARVAKLAKGTRSGPGDQAIALPDQQPSVNGPEDETEALALAALNAEIGRMQANDELRAQAFVKSADELRLKFAADAPPVPPPDTEPLAEPLSKVALTKTLLSEVQNMLATRHLDGVASNLEAASLVLDLERARLEALKKSGQDAGALEKFIAQEQDLRTQVQTLTRASREPLKEVHGDPVETKYDVGKKLQSRLDSLGVDIRHAFSMVKVDMMHVEKVQAFLGELEVSLGSILKDIEAQKAAGYDTKTLEAWVVVYQRDLRRLHKRAKDAIGELTQAEVSPEALKLYQPETAPEAQPDKKTRQPRKRTLAERAPAPVPQVQKPAEIVAPAPEAPKSAFARARQTVGNALSYIRDGWKRVYREEVLGELAPHELDPSRKVSWTEAGLQASAGVLGGLASTFGVALGPDMARYVTQSVAAMPERNALKAAVAEAVRTRRALYGVDRPEGETHEARRERLFSEHQVRREQLMNKINNSRRLSPEARAALFTKLDAALRDFESQSNEIQAGFQDEIGVGIHETLNKAQTEAERILDTHVRSKISEGKLLKESVNSALAAGSVAALFTGAGSVFAGMHFARGPAYSAQAFIERYRKTGKEFARGERKTDASVVTVMKEGFTEWTSKLFGRESRIRDRRQALSTLLRASGMGLTSVVAGGALMVEGATDIDFDSVLDHAFAQVKEYAHEVYEKVFEATPEVPAFKLGHKLEMPGAPEIADPGMDVGHVFRGSIPEGSRVLGGPVRYDEHGQAIQEVHDGITQVLKRVIQRNPEAYGFQGESEVGADLFAKRMATQIAEGDGQMRRWLTSKAADKLNLFPEKIGDEWHIAAVVDGKKLTLDELAARGYTSTAPEANK